MRSFCVNRNRNSIPVLVYKPGQGWFRAYSFCAVFLFRFINRNRNRRVQKERLSLRGTISMVTKWRSVWFQTEKVKSTKTYKHTRTKFEKKIRRLSWQTSVFANRVTSSFFLVSLRTCIHGYQQEMESGCCVDSRPCQREKRWERCGTSGCGGTSTKASAQKIVFQAAHEDKERNENVDVPA